MQRQEQSDAEQLGGVGADGEKAEKPDEEEEEELLSRKRGRIRWEIKETFGGGEEGGGEGRKQVSNSDKMD